jgi:hypothetical protein
MTGPYWVNCWSPNVNGVCLGISEPSVLAELQRRQRVFVFLSFATTICLANIVVNADTCNGMHFALGISCVLPRTVRGPSGNVKWVRRGKMLYSRIKLLFTKMV